MVLHIVCIEFLCRDHRNPFGVFSLLVYEVFWNSEILEGIRRQSLSRDPKEREVTEPFHSSGMRDVCDVEPAAHAMIHRSECAQETSEQKCK